MIFRNFILIIITNIFYCFFYPDTIIICIRMCFINNSITGLQIS